MCSRCRDLLLGLLFAGLAAGCEREQRRFEQPPATGAATLAALGTLRLGDLQPGTPIPAAPVANRHEENAYAVAQGKKLFRAYNCNGCHGQGGGGSGPALMDDRWIYGSAPLQVYASIAQGRPNGMPSFAGHVGDDQLWQIAAYVRSMSGLLRADVTPSRSDTLQAAEPEQRREEQAPAASSPAMP